MDGLAPKLPADLKQQFRGLVSDYSGRDKRHKQVASARRGDVEEVMPGVFPQSWPKPIVANVIDTTAEDLARVLARLPSVDCASSNTVSERAKQFAAKRTKIALHYLDRSRIKKQLTRGADWYFTFGAMPVIAEPDFETQSPTLRIDDPRGAYWRTNHFGDVSVYVKTWEESCGSLAAKFPQYADKIKSTDKQQFGQPAVKEDSTLKVARMYTRKGIYLFLPDRGDLLLAAAPQPLGKCPVEIAELPSWDTESRGHFDDVMWVWLARARMALYGMEAAHKSIHAPLAVPQDVQRVPLGPDALIRSNEAEKIRRVPIEFPQAALIESQLLQQELQAGSAYPQARSGNIDASIITGKGVEALSGIFSTQIASAQEDVGDTLRRALMLCFEMDELYWPDTKKPINGMSNGAPFTDSYTPAKDIKGEYTVSVSYGFTAGMDANRALVFLLQLRGDRAIDRDTLQRQLPFETDTVQLNQSIDIEEMEDALKQGLYGLASNLPAMMQQGMDPSQALQQIAQIVKDRKGGKAMYEAVLDALTPEPQPEAPVDPLAQALGAGGLGGAGGGAPSPEGLGPAQMMGGGSGDLAMLMAGLTSSGGANLQANVSRRLSAQ
jgi:hypothetical protein